jgi:hypothetical protein
MLRTIRAARPYRHAFPGSTTAVTAAPPAVSGRRGQGAPRPRPELIATKDEVLESVNNGGRCILNALSPEDHAGKTVNKYGRLGRITSSVNVPAGVAVPATLVDAPWLRRLQPNGEDVSLTMRTDDGDVRIDGDGQPVTHIDQVRRVGEGGIDDGMHGAHRGLRARKAWPSPAWRNSPKKNPSGSSPQASVKLKSV